PRPPVAPLLRCRAPLSPPRPPPPPAPRSLPTRRSSDLEFVQGGGNAAPGGVPQHPHPAGRQGRGAQPVQGAAVGQQGPFAGQVADRKSTRLNSSHVSSSYAVFCLKKKIRARSCTAPTGQ